MRKIGLIILLLIGFTDVNANCVTGIVPVPIVDSITVNIAGDVTICWQSVADPDVTWYKIFKLDPFTSANVLVDSVPVGTNCYTILAGFNNSDIESVELGVVAMDVCDNLSAVGANYTNTMYLENLPDPCDASISLFWNPYDDFTSGLNVLYSIYVSINSAGYILAGTSLTPNYTYTGVIQGATYDFYVMAVENVGAGPFSSSSNDININTITFLKDPLYSYLYAATVVDSLEINLQFYVDTAADISLYRIQRATNIAGPYTNVGSVSAYTGMNPLVQYTDNNSLNANSTYYFYKVETVNDCGLLRYTSNIGRTIWTKTKSDPINATNTITITQYDGWLGNVATYDIYRAVAGVWEASPIATISSFLDTVTYLDDITSVFEGNGEYCYKVIATETNVAHIGGLPIATSVSNESCALHEPLMYVPNAFAPQSSYNPIFKPVLTFSDPAAYVFQIYNRWGQKIFETGDVTEGWNGAENNSGKMSQVGTYVYIIKFQSAKGEEFEKTGSVTLLH